MAAPTVPAKMRALVKDKEGEGFTLKEIDVPDPEGDEVLIRVDAVAICGSDLVLYKWTEAAQQIATLPFIPGHETVGTVVKVGPDATVALGQRITVENHYFCGDCHQCKNNLLGLCQNMGQYGHGRKTTQGGCAQYSLVPSKYCYQLKTDVSVDDAVLMEALGVSHNAIAKLEVAGEDVLITGCGPIGLMGCQVAKALGAARVIAADVMPFRLALAKQMGADVIVNPAEQDMEKFLLEQTAGNGIGRICEMSGSNQVINNMFGWLRKGGHVVMVGIPKNPIEIKNTIWGFVFKSMTLKTIHGRRVFQDWEECERLIDEKKLHLQPLISHRVPMTRFEEAFEALFSGNACKIIMDPQK